MTGTIKPIQPDKTFGFITPDGESKDVFFHESALGEGKTIKSLNLKGGEKVTFDLAEGKDGKGPSATNVTLVE